MANNIFRRKSLDRLNNPEQLNDYIKVSNISSWMIMAIVAAFLLLFILWAAFGAIAIKENTVVVVKDGKANVYVSSAQADKLHSGLELSGFSSRAVLASVPAEAIQITPSFDTEARSIAHMQTGEFYYVCPVDYTFDTDGAYPASVIFGTVTPLSYLLNQESGS